jgi:hypothetical protein
MEISCLWFAEQGLQEEGCCWKVLWWLCEAGMEFETLLTLRYIIAQLAVDLCTAAGGPLAWLPSAGPFQGVCMQLVYVL